MKKKGYRISDTSDYVNTGESGRGYEVPGEDVRVGPKRYAATNKNTSPPYGEIGPETTDVRKAKKYARWHKEKKYGLGEEVEQISERQMKAKKVVDAGAGPLPRMHIIQQLERAAQATVPVTVTFGDGSAHEVHPDHAAELVTKYRGMKRPMEKFEFQAKVGKSHAGLQDELK